MEHPPEPDLVESLAHLNGFLHALARISGHVFYSAVAFRVFDDLDSSISDHVASWGVEAKYGGRTKIDYEEAGALLQRQIYDRLKCLPSDTVELLDWDLREYYGLVAGALVPDGPFNPLISGPLFKVRVERSDVEDGEYFLIQIAQYALLTSLVQRAA